MVEIIKDKKQVIDALKNGARLHRERKPFYRYPFIYSLYSSGGVKIADVSYGVGNKIDCMPNIVKNDGAFRESIFTWKVS